MQSVQVVTIAPGSAHVVPSMTIRFVHAVSLARSALQSSSSRYELLLNSQRHRRDVVGVGPTGGTGAAELSVFALTPPSPVTGPASATEGCSLAVCGRSLVVSWAGAA
jgi:hypothetical protein